MEVKKQQITHNFINQTVTSVLRVAIEMDGSSEILVESLVLTLSDGREFEVLVDQASVFVRQITPDEGLFASFELEEGESLRRTELDFQVDVPFTIASVTEIWSGQEMSSFLTAIVLWDSNRNALLSLCTETDELEVLTIDELWLRINEMPFHYGSVLHLWYDK